MWTTSWLSPLASASPPTPSDAACGLPRRTDSHLLTPEVSGTADQLWQWAQGERAIPVPLPDLPSEFGSGDRALEFTIRTRPYLTAARAPEAATAHPHPNCGTCPSPSRER